jgi:hypothetical protein
LCAQQCRLHINGGAVDIAVLIEFQRDRGLPSVLVELITDRLEMVENCRSSCVATEEAMVSGLAPGSVAVTEIVGVS